jgi:hypothetical protein
MTSRANLDVVKVHGRVRNGVIVTEQPLPEGASVSVELDHHPDIGVVDLDANGDIIMTPGARSRARCSRS